MLHYFHRLFWLLSLYGRLVLHAAESSEIIKVIVSSSRTGEKVAIERHRSRVPVDLPNIKESLSYKKHVTDFLGQKEQALQYGIGGFSLKQFCLAKSSAGKCASLAKVTDRQWQLELPNLTSDEGSSELNS